MRNVSPICNTNGKTKVSVNYDEKQYSGKHSFYSCDGSLTRSTFVTHLVVCYTFSSSIPPFSIYFLPFLSLYLSIKRYLTGCLSIPSNVASSFLYICITLSNSEHSSTLTSPWLTYYLSLFNHIELCLFLLPLISPICIINVFHSATTSFYIPFQSSNMLHPSFKNVHKTAELHPPIIQPSFSLLLNFNKISYL